MARSRGSGEPRRIAATDVSEPRPAGEFTRWLAASSATRETGAAMDVPCGTCTACCRAAYFIHVDADETDTLAAIPPALLFPAPGQPSRRVLGFDERGHCPMLADGACSIYPQRPRVCRHYDCRVFTASGIPPERARAEVAARVRAWEFAYPAAEDRRQQAAVTAAAQFLTNHAGLLPRGFVPGNATQQAVLAIDVHRVFLDADEVCDPADLAHRVVAAARVSRD